MDQSNMDGGLGLHPSVVRRNKGILRIRASTILVLTCK